MVLPELTTSLLSGGGVMIVGAMLRWGWKVDKGLSASVASMLLLEERLKGTKEVAETRSDGIEHRLSLLETRLAPNGRRA